MVGLLIVHGIGNQRPGTLGRLVAQSLGAGSPVREADPVALPETGAGQGDAGAIWRVMVEGRPVHVCEAHWADLSTPDNPPALRVAAYLLRDYLQTVAHAWHGFVQRTFLAGKTRKPLSAGGFLAIAALLALVLGGIVAASIMMPAKGAWSDWLYGLLGAVVLVSLATSVTRFTQSSLAWVRARFANSQPLVLSIAVVITWLLAIAIGYIRFFVLLAIAVMSAELLLLLLVPVVISSFLNYLGLMPVLMLQDVSAGLGALRFKLVRRWINRLGWLVLVLPLQTLCQTTKALANLVSVAFARHSAATRWAAVLAVPGVYVAFIVLIVHELLVLLLLPFIALGAVRLLLQVLDLILDISNFHLASSAERQPYFERVRHGVERLQRSGCREIHILAHSLGTVITYDWLTSQASRDYPVKVLHTIGSPLEKFWYTDHPEDRRFADEAGLAAHPSIKWYNYWAFSDPVSAPLDHFGRGKGSAQNIRIKRLGAFLYSHVRYWTHPQIIGGVSAEIRMKGMNRVGPC